MSRLLPAIVLPLDPLTERGVESAFEIEYETAKSAGFTCLFWGGDDRLRLDAKSDASVLQRCESALYRGWMLTREGYLELIRAMATRSLRPATTLDQYLRCHHFPGWYDRIADVTVNSIWVEVNGAVDMNMIHDRLAAFGDRPIIVKDFVKSQKHYWNEACFIPSAASQPDVERVTHRFIELQDNQLNGGLVYREFVKLASLGVHPRSGMPLSLEYRAFLLNGVMVSLDPYWDGDVGVHEKPDRAWIESIAQRISSPFLTIDVAQRLDGRWVVMEVGDGQVSGLPNRCTAAEFYSELAAALRNPRLGSL